ncbi:MAG: hypothetical protein NVSMB9_10000 [Isosphaeraceae bacterium]
MTEPNPTRPDRTWLYIGLAFLAFWGGYLFLIGPPGQHPPGNLENSALTQPADYSWRALDLDDNPFEFSRYKGKTVFLNIWATSCPPCVREMPSIASLARQPGLKDVAFVCVSTDDASSTVKHFLAGKNWPMTILRATSLPPVFFTEGIPATFLIAPDGRIAASQIGSSNWDDPKVVALLEGMAKAPGNAPAPKEK